MRLKPEERRLKLLNAALIVAEDVGYIKISYDSVAKYAGVTPGLVRYYFNTVRALKDEVIQYAIEQEHLLVLGSALLCREPYALAKVPKRLKLKVFDTL
jgi:AcrR family transcriptional regulator